MKKLLLVCLSITLCYTLFSATNYNTQITDEGPEFTPLDTTTYKVISLYSTAPEDGIFRKNSIYIGTKAFYPLVTYGRTFKGKKWASLSLNGGIMYLGGLHLSSDLTFLLGGQRSFFEGGVGIFTQGSFEKPNKYYIIGYRYMGKKGLFLKAGMQVGSELNPGYIGIGYSF